MADSLQESLKIASRRKQQWMERMKEAGYIIVGENAFKRTKDKTSPSGYRDLLVTSYGKDFRNKYQVFEPWTTSNICSSGMWVFFF